MSEFPSRLVFSRHPVRWLRIVLPAGVSGILISCGGGNSAPSAGTTPQPVMNTSIKLLVSSTGNDRISSFFLTFTSITLTSKSGKAVTADLAQNGLSPSIEFMHRNGGIEPLATISVPQDVYVSASATIATYEINCVAPPPSGGVSFSAFAGPSSSSYVATVNLPEPITVLGTNMALLLNLPVSESANVSNCNSGVVDGAYFSIAPTFDLTAATIGAQPTSSANGKVDDLKGMVVSVDSASSFVVATPDFGPVWSVNVDSNTLFQGGIADLAALGVRMPVDMDMAIQPDGSLLATRLAVLDANTVDTAMRTGPILGVSAAGSTFTTLLVQEQGLFAQATVGAYPFNGASFQTSGRFTNIRNLPFLASFNASNMVAGQYVTMSIHAGAVPTYLAAPTITLMPQTIDGTVTGVAGNGGFTVFTVALANYDIFAAFGSQPGQATILQDPGTVTVYADSNTRMLNTASVTTGSVMRFSGLIFNDNGALRMDCSDVLDGVAL